METAPTTETDEHYGSRCEDNADRVGDSDLWRCRICDLTVTRADPAGPVTQTILASDPVRKGNCVSACVATVLGVPLVRVPHFVEYGLHLGDDATGKVSNGNAWWAMMLGYFYGAGLELVELGSVSDAAPGEFLMVAGMSPRGVLHQVVYRDGALWHDPHPSRDGVLDVQEVLAVRPLTGFDHEPTN